MDVMEMVKDAYMCPPQTKQQKMQAQQQAQQQQQQQQQQQHHHSQGHFGFAVQRAYFTAKILATPN